MLKIGFLGEYEHTVDEKGRVSIPSKYKKYIEKITVDPDSRSMVILIKGRQKCIEVFPVEDWVRMMNEFSQGMKIDDENEERDYVNNKFKNAIDAKIDKSGRILVPANLKTYAGIKKDVVITGGGDRFMIWDKLILKNKNKK